MTKIKNPISVGPFTFRVRPANGTRQPFIAEAIEGKFSAGSIVHEPPPAECWFQFGATAEEALGKVLAECLLPSPAPNNALLIEAAQQALGSLKALGAERGYASQALREALGISTLSERGEEEERNPAPQHHVRGQDLTQELYSALQGLMTSLVGDEFADDIPAVVTAKAVLEKARAALAAEGPAE